MVTAEPGFATQLSFEDASWRPFSLVHYHGRGTATFFLKDHRHHELRIDRRVARELARTFDHFARHQELPLWGHEPDWSI